jgi:ABC-type lipopolysaccharide export system ATPase subunit
MSPLPASIAGGRISGIISLLKSKGSAFLSLIITFVKPCHDRAYIISDGKIIEAGTAEEIGAAPGAAVLPG